MSVLSIVFIVVGVVLVSALLLIAGLSFFPLVFTIDTGSRQVSVRWIAVLEYRRPLPGGEGQAALSFAGKSLAPRVRKEKRKRRKAKVRKPRKRRATFGRFLRRCLGEPVIRRVLARRLRELWRRILRSVTLTRRQITVSLPDPAWNGMLMGWQAMRGDRGRSAFRVNFSGENSLFLEVRLYPYRIANAFLLFLIGLPYRALLREWRAAAAIASG